MNVGRENSNENMVVTRVPQGSEDHAEGGGPEALGDVASRRN